MRKRDEQILLRVSKTERATLAIAAQKLGLTVNDFVRLRALAAASDEADSGRFDARVTALEEAMAGALAAVREDIKNDLRALSTANIQNFQKLSGLIAKR